MTTEIALWSEVSPLRRCRCGELWLKMGAAKERVGLPGPERHEEGGCRVSVGLQHPLFPGESDAELVAG